MINYEALVNSLRLLGFQPVGREMEDGQPDIMIKDCVGGRVSTTRMSMDIGVNVIFTGEDGVNHNMIHGAPDYTSALDALTRTLRGIGDGQENHTSI
jgi:hypothetical protein